MNTDKFKFRAFDGTHMHYFTFDDVQNGRIFVRLLDPTGFCKDYHQINLRDCQITQCTGEKDKNGKLIYDGDIIHQFNHHDYEYYLKQVNSITEVSHPNECIILGNIFQHPELLTK